MTAGLVFVCGCCGKTVGQDMFLDNQNVVFKLNDPCTRQVKYWDIYPNKKCVRLLKWFGDGEYEKKDVMILTVEIVDAVPNEVKISHIVAL